jgi:thiamine pyrophosphokinase
MIYTIENDFDVVILANGLFPQHERLRSLIRTAPMLVCCDGAASHLREFGKKPHCVIGDMDSIPEPTRELWKDILVHKENQDNNDLTKAFEYCVEQGCKKVLILGGTGIREDHALANITLLHTYLQRVPKVVMISDFGVFTPIVETTSFQSVVGQPVSLFSLTPDCPISSKGLKYPLDHLQLKSLWNGTLNEALGEEFTVVLESKGEVIVYQCHSHLPVVNY